MREMKAKVFNAYAYFVVGAVLFAAITFVQLPCPACHGTGMVEGAGSLRIAGVEADLLDHDVLGIECGWDYERYTYKVRVSVVNEATAPAYGTVMVSFHDPEESYTLIVEENDEEVTKEFSGETLEAFPFFVEVPAKGSKVIEETVMFDGVTMELFGGQLHLVDATTASEYRCPFHDKSARVNLTEWLRLR